MSFHLRMAMFIFVMISNQACSSGEIGLNRRYLLDPTMDSNSTVRIGSSLGRSAVERHDITAQGAQSSLGGSCPTCGSK